MKLSVAEILAATGGALVRGSTSDVVENVSTDSRTLRPGDFFVAIVGERFDGHAFLSQVAEKGACGALICREMPDEVLRALPLVIRVSETLDALGKWASFVRERIRVPVVGITGSNGKTTTKEFTAAVLGENILKAEASFNNLLGVSQTLLRFEPRHRYAVLEVGTNHFGEVASLVKIVRPNVGAFLNVTASHTEFFGDEDGVAREKSTLPLAAEHAVLNADDSRVIAYAPQCRRVTTFGTSPSADVRATAIEIGADGLPRFELSIGGRAVGRPSLRMFGRHNVMNALAAAAIGVVLEIPASEIVAHLEGAKSAKMRMERLDAVNGAVLYNDAYNANPASVRAAWDFFRAVDVTGRRWVVLGEMLELGEKAAEYHQAAASALSPEMCDVFLPLGPHAPLMAEAAKTAGINAVLLCASTEEVGRTLAGMLQSGDAVLLKASRGVRLESVLTMLQASKPSQ